MRTVIVANATKIDTERAEALRRQVARAFARVGWPEPGLELTTPQDAGSAIARRAVRRGAELVVACGGDGTVNAVAEALAGSGAALGILPLGTGNLLAGNLGVPSRREQAIEVLCTGASRRIDLGRVGERVFVGMAGLGLDAAMVADVPDGLKARIGWPAYAVAIVRHLRDRGTAVELELDGRRVRHTGVRTLLIGNIGRLHGGLELLPEAAPDDGLLDVIVLAPRGRLRGWPVVLARLLARRDRGSASIARYRARHVTVRTRGSIAQELDGEVYRTSDRFTVDVEPAALIVRVPRTVPPRSTPRTAAAEVVPARNAERSAR